MKVISRMKGELVFWSIWKSIHWDCDSLCEKQMKPPYKRGMMTL